MLATLIIVFREVIEAGLIVGIVLAATSGVPRRSLWVGCGVLGGMLGACLVAIFANTISASIEGVGQEIFNVIILLAAVVMLTWHNVWMARHGREVSMHMRNIGDEVSKGRRSLLALSVVVGIAVLREGSEIVLFIYGIALSGNDTSSAMAVGALLGLALGIALGAATYKGLVHIPNRLLFTVTGWLISLLAAGMAAQAMAFLQQAEIITAFPHAVWNTSNFLSETSLGGKVLHTLIGYTDRPTGMQLIAYLTTITIIFALMRLFGRSCAASSQINSGV